MNIVSIDIGIKNLAICIIKINQNNFEIIYWNVINLCDDTPKKCIYINKNKSCTNNAKFYNCDKCYCKKHSDKTDYVLPCANLKNYKKLKLLDLTELIEKYNIPCSNSPNKTNYIAAICDFIEKHQLSPIENINANNVDLINLGIKLKETFDIIDFTDVNCVLIENQISPIANRMKCLQGMIAQYFIMNEINNIHFISSANKLKLFLDNKKTTYSERKKIGIKYCNDTLVKNNIDDKWKIYFNINKKADDLADCFLQAYWYIITNTLIKI